MLFRFLPCCPHACRSGQKSLQRLTAAADRFIARTALAFARTALFAGTFDLLLISSAGLTSDAGAGLLVAGSNTSPLVKRSAPPLESRAPSYPNACLPGGRRGAARASRFLLAS